LTIGMGGVVVLLLLGTQILNWYWVVLLAVASLAAGLYRARKKIPSVYTIAQWIDRRLNLADTLSTATYFSGADTSSATSPTAASARAEIRRQQREQAELTAKSVDVREGIPFMRPRYLYPALILAAVAFGMFVLRYAVTGSLSLQPSLARIAFDTFFPSRPEQAKINRKQPDRSKMDPDSPDDPQGDQQQDAALEAMDRNNPADPQASQRTQESKQGDRSGENNDAVKKDTSQQDESQNGEQKEGKQAPQQGGNSPNQNLMDKLRDVMSNMMNKMTSSGQNPSQQNKSSNGRPIRSPRNRAIRRTTVPKAHPSRLRTIRKTRVAIKPRTRPPRLTARAESGPPTATRKRAKPSRTRSWERSARSSASDRLESAAK
jgi:hypothetical protein